jgi:serine/threonine protein kinase
MSLPQSAPKRVGRYKLLAPIARGGAATVYLGRSEGIGGFQRIVAVKLLHPHLLEDASSQAANEFLEEAKLSARMQHPMIVPVMDVGHSDEGFYLVMDYVDGASLSEIAREEVKVPPGVALRILSDALEGLEAAHQAKDEKGRHLGIVHRDFSPQNILVGIDGRSRLTDFGIARATTRAEYTRTGLVKGKVAYMSPEQAEGKPLDIRSDVWAAGVVAWELFAGRRMYPQMDPMPMMLRIINDPPPLLRKGNPELPVALEEAVSMALEPDRKLRCASALEFRGLLLGALGGESKLATREEVGSFVAGLAIERLDELRAIVQEESRSLEVGGLRVSPDQVETVEDRSAHVQMESGTFATTSAEMPSALTTSEMERQLLGPRTRVPRILGTVGVLGLVTLLALFSLKKSRLSTDAENRLSQQTEPQQLMPQESPASTSTKAPRPSGQQVSSETGRTPSAAALRSEITVSAEVPFESVTVGARTIVLPAPTTTATIQLREDERGEKLAILAMTADGRKARATASETDDKVLMTFAGPTQRLRAKAVSPRPASKPSPSSDLAASPY